MTDADGFYTDILKTAVRMRQKEWRKIIKQINDFDEICDEDQYTDTGDAWDLLNRIREIAQEMGGE